MRFPAVIDEIGGVLLGFSWEREVEFATITPRRREGREKWWSTGGGYSRRRRSWVLLVRK